MLRHLLELHCVTEVVGEFVLKSPSAFLSPFLLSQTLNNRWICPWGTGHSTCASPEARFHTLTPCSCSLASISVFHRLVSGMDPSGTCSENRLITRHEFKQQFFNTTKLPPLPQPQATFCGARRSKHLHVAPTAAQEERQRALPLPFPRPLRDAAQVDGINPQDARMVSLALNTFTEKALRPERHLWVTSV